MVNNLAIKKGFTLLEMTIVILIVGILLDTTISNGMSFINRARFQATVREMSSIAQAAIAYYDASGNPNDPTNLQSLVWPSTDVSKLGSPFMPQAVLYNPFGFSYKLAFANDMVTVSTNIPKGILIDKNEGSFLNTTPGSMQDQISITRSVPNEFSGRLFYDLKYLDK